MNYEQHILNILNLAREILSSNGNLTGNVDNLNSNGEKSIEMDVKIEEAVVAYIGQNNLPVKIFAEEKGDIDVCPVPEYFLTFDPLDGSTNYTFGRELLPYGFLISIFSSLQPKLSQVIYAGAFEYNSKRMWLYANGKTIDVSSGSGINLNYEITPDTHTPVYIDLYRKSSYDHYSKIAEQVFVRNTGSTIGNLALTLGKASTLLAGSVIKPEEIGAIYALIKGAGGKVVTEKGLDFGDQLFDSHKTYGLIAGNPTVVDFVLDRLA